MLRGCDTDNERTQLRDLIYTKPEDRLARDPDLPEWMQHHTPSWWGGDEAAYRDGMGVQGMLSKLKQG